MCAEAAAYYKQNGKTLYDVLLELYETYGCYREDLVTITLKGKVGAEKIQAILKDFRENTPNVIANKAIISLEDYQASTYLDLNTQTNSDILLPKSNVLKYTFEDGSWFVLRPSGTEPKAKIYIGVIADTIEAADEQVVNIKEAVLTRVNNIIK